MNEKGTRGMFQMKRSVGPYFFRVGKVSIEPWAQACLRLIGEMRTRPRPSDEVARCVGEHEVRAYTQKLKCERARDYLSALYNGSSNCSGMFKL